MYDIGNSLSCIDYFNKSVKKAMDGDYIFSGDEYQISYKNCRLVIDPYIMHEINEELMKKLIVIATFLKYRNQK